MKKLGFGLMRLPTLDGDHTKIDLEQVKEMADAFLAAGGTYFDTAYPYHGGFSEIALREAVVKRYPREKFTVTDKMPIFKLHQPEEFEPIFQEQLERCGVEYFDYYWLHALGDGSYAKVQRLDGFGFIARKKAEGKIRHIGFSFHGTAELLERVLTDHPEVEYVQLQVNYLDWDDPTIRARECYEIAARHKKPVIVMEPVKGGGLARVPEEAERKMRAHSPEASPASWALRFAASQENVMVVLSGMSDMAQMRDNLSFMMDFRPLDEAERTILNECADILRSKIAIPCTQCRYCVSEQECPKHIAIPEYFAIYNNLKRFTTQNVVAATYYHNLSKVYGKAGECIGCGGCERHCPQHLPIREHLKQVAEALER